MSAYDGVYERVVEVVENVSKEVKRRGYSAANELRNQSLEVLRGGRGGRRYRVPGTKRYYTASAPGEPPAVMTGAFRNSWQTRVDTKPDEVRSMIESGLRVNGYLLGALLEDGTSKMAPRPYKERIIEKAMPQIKAIFSAPYHP